jgi:glycosyltransferase involved in cell wall biosynthesis
MRIAFLTHQFPGARMGGIGGYTLSAAAALASLGHDVHLFTFSIPENAQPALPSNVFIHFIPDLAGRIADGTARAESAAAIASGGEPMHRLAMGTLLADAVLERHRTTPFDIVEGPEYEGLTLPLLWRLSHHEDRPAIITHIHSGSSINRRGNDQSPTTQDFAIDAIERASIILADARCAATNAVVRETRVTLPFEQSIEILPLIVGVTEPHTPPPADGAILFIGRLERLKGADTLILAANIFLCDHPNARMEFIGPDTPTAPPSSSGERSMKAWMGQMIDPQFRDRLLFTGEIPPREVARHIRAAKFIVSPSLFENFSLVASEAIAAGRPVITTEGIGTVDVIGDAGLTFPRNDVAALAAAMDRLWTSPSLLNTLADAAYRRAQTFSRESITQRRVQFYEQTLSSKHPLDSPTFRSPDVALLDPLLSITHALCGLPPLATKATPGTQLLAIMDRIAKKTGIPRSEVILYGAGRFSARLLAEQHLWTRKGHAVVAFLDDHPRWKQGGTHLGIPVIPKETLLSRTSIPAVILCTDTFEDQFWNQTADLRERGVEVYRLSSA